MADQPDVDPFEAAIDEWFEGATETTEPEGTPPPEPVEGEEEQEPEGEEEPVEEPEEGDDEGDEEDAEEGEPEQAGETEVLEIPEGATLKLPDGTEVAVDEAALFQSDYTKKTQAVAERQRELDEREQELTSRAEEFEQAEQQLVDWIAERRDNPSDWVAEIVSSAQEPTIAVARALRTLAQQGALEPRFVEVFGIEQGEVADIADRGEESDRVTRLEEQLRQQEQAREAEAERQRVIADYQQQYRNIVEGAELTFESEDDEVAFRQELLDFAKAEKITNLEHAYAVMKHRKGDTGKSSPSAKGPDKQPDPAVQRKKKRAARAVSPRSAAAPGGTQTPPKDLSTEDAALAAFEEVLAGRS